MEKDKIKSWELFYLFLFGCVFGWIFEGLWTLLKKGLIINHSAMVIGPINLIYGIGCVMLVLLLKNFRKSHIKTFIISFVSGSVLEYVASVFMEKTSGFVAWDYSSKFLNINGRISLFYSLAWGFVGVLFINFIYHKVIKLIRSFKPKEAKKVMVIISVFLVFDMLLTFAAVNRGKKYDLGIEPQNQFEVYLDKYFGVDYLNNMYNNRWNKK